MKFVIDQNRCIACYNCEEICPVGAISHEEFKKPSIDDDVCVFCGRCVEECPTGSISEVM